MNQRDNKRQQEEIPMKTIHAKTSVPGAALRGTKEDVRIYRIALTGLFAALSYIVFTFLQIKITLPGGTPRPFTWETRSACWAPCSSGDFTGAWEAPSA